jgi:aspartyl-tRNA(Asn)/glutamyl-tRNA(Gln) amidotransferase subunit C
MIDTNVIEKTVKLANLAISDEEKSQYTEQLSQILSYVEKISALDTEGVEPAESIAGITNVMRDDVTAPSIDKSEIAKIAPRFENGFVVVPKIIDSEA